MSVAGEQIEDGSEVGRSSLVQNCLIGLISIELFKGGSSLAQATAHTPLACLAFGNLQLQVYFRNPKGQVAYVKYTGGWRTPIIITSIGPGFNLAVLEWDTGNRLRLYYQEFSGALAEHCSDDGGNTWFLGKFHIAGE